MAKKFDKWRTPEGMAEIAEMIAKGVKYEDIADQIGCNRNTLCNWLKMDEYGTVKEACDIKLQALENAAMKKATGYRYKEVTWKYDSDGNKRKVSEVEKEAQPDAYMLAFLMKNEDPNKYRDKHEVETDGTVTIRFEGGSGGASWDEISG